MSSKGKAMSENAPPTRQRPLPLPDLDAFRILLLVGELGSLGRAAVAEGIAQPSATARLAALERRLGIALVDRSPRGSTLTEEGRIVSDWAREVLTAVDTLLAGAHALRSRNAQLRVAASQTIAECLVPEWLREFARREPGVGVGLHVANSAHAIRGRTRNRPAWFRRGTQSSAGVVVPRRGCGPACCRRSPVSSMGHPEAAADGCRAVAGPARGAGGWLGYSGDPRPGPSRA
jgi:DNA-binding transcriptional LysR family regulator